MDTRGDTTMTKALMVSMGLALAAGCLDPGDPGNLVPRTVAEDPTLPQIEVAGTRLHAEAFGDPTAPTVIVLHGGPGSDYRSLLPLKALASDGYRVVFWDQRGAGLSQRHDADSYSFPQYLEDLRLVVEKMATPSQPFVFIGHSWGAMYATWFINDYGDYGGRLKGAILSDPGAFTTKQLEAFLDRLQGSVDLQGEQLNDALWSGQFMSAADHARADYMRLMFSLRGAPSEHKSRVNPPPLWRGGAVVNQKLLSLAKNPGFDFTTRLKSFGKKVLFLRAENNPATPLAQQKELASSYAEAEVITLPGTGHEMIWDAPEVYLAHAHNYFKAIGFAGVGR
jgi:proline iminopeptidase